MIAWRSKCASWAAVVALSVGGSSLLATELLPGESLRGADLSSGSAGTAVYGSDLLATSESIGYSLPPVGIHPASVWFGGLTSWQSHTVGGSVELVYQFNVPYFEGPPPIPGSPYPIVTGDPLGGSDTISISGFGDGPIDVARAPNYISGSAGVSVGSIERYVSGDVITFGGFASDPSFLLGSASDWFTLVAPGRTFGNGVATASVTDIDGSTRVLTVDAVGPVPEPGVAGLLALAIGALGIRLRLERATG